MSKKKTIERVLIKNTFYCYGEEHILINNNNNIKKMNDIIYLY